MTQVPLAVIHGRFQPLHCGHLEYLLAGKALADVLVVGITNPDPWLLGQEEAAPERGQVSANPCSFWERLLMVEGSLLEAGLSRDQFRVVPFPHSYPERLRFYAPPEALYLLTIYDEWGEVKRRRFEGLGLHTHVMWRRTDKVTSGTEVRELMAEDGDWRAWMPPAAARVIEAYAIDERVRQRRVGATP